MLSAKAANLATGEGFAPILMPATAEAITRSEQAARWCHRYDSVVKALGALPRKAVFDLGRSLNVPSARFATGDTAWRDVADEIARHYAGTEPEDTSAKGGE